MSTQKIIVVGAGITGLWQALLFAEKGHDVTLIEKSATPFEDSASQYAGAMLAPYCEAEIIGSKIEELGIKSLDLWKTHYPDLKANGSLVVALPRDKSELRRYARQTSHHTLIDNDQLADLEPDLANNFTEALYFPDECHLDPYHALPFLLDKVKAAGVSCKFGTTIDNNPDADWVIDCRGLDARDALENLRGVRGERIVIRTEEITLTHAIHLAHPRFPIYIVPWPDNKFMVGATMIETMSEAPISVRSALELLSAAFALHPAFAEAEIVSTNVGVRPAFPDNLPKIVVAGRKLYVNGLYRNGFLMAPRLAQLACDYVEQGARDEEVFVEDHIERRTG